MINGLEGIPGSGKSYELAAFQVLPALESGRLVITNLPLEVEAYAAIDPAYRKLIEIRTVPQPVRGTWDANRVDAETGVGEAFQLFDDGRWEAAPSKARVFGHVWDYYSPWRHPKSGKGPLFVIDECHVAMPKMGTDAEVIEWYKLHRHFHGTDVLLATQMFRQMCADIAGLMAMVIKVRKADVLGKSDSYIRKVHAGYRGAVIQDSVRAYEPAYFKLYRSQTQGSNVLESSATDVAPVSVKLRRWTRGMWGFALVCCIFAVWQFTKPKPQPATRVKASVNAFVRDDGKTDIDALNRAIAAENAGRATHSPPTVENAPVAAVVQPEPYAGKGMHLTGMMRMGAKVMYTFAVSNSGAVIAQVTDADLVRAGYTWVPLTDCAGYLRYGGAAKAITCDAPRVQPGSDERPLVMNQGYGSDGRTPAKPAGAATQSPGLVSM